MTKPQKIPLFSRKTTLVFVFLCAGAVDLISKFLVVEYNPKSVLYNSGVAFSMFSVSEVVPKMMMFVSVVVGITGLLIAVVKRAQMTTTCRLGVLLIASGAFANGVDRCFNMLHNVSAGASVTDFINYSDLFTGNVADVFVVLGSIVLAVSMVLETKSNR